MYIINIDGWYVRSVNPPILTTDESKAKTYKREYNAEMAARKFERNCLANGVCAKWNAKIELS